MTFTFDLWPWDWLCIICVWLNTYKPNLVKKSSLVTKIWPKKYEFQSCDLDFWPLTLILNLHIIVSNPYLKTKFDEKNLHWLQRYGPNKYAFQSRDLDLWPMTLILNLHNIVSKHHLKTKFGEKIVIGYKDMAQTNIHSSLMTLTFDLWPWY